MCRTRCSISWTIRELAELFDCDRRPTRSTPPGESAGSNGSPARSCDAASSRPDSSTRATAPTTLSLDELRTTRAVRVEEILRLEPMIERLILESSGSTASSTRYRAALDDLRGRRIVGLKSVIAYRSGLQRRGRRAGDAPRPPSPTSTTRHDATASSGSSRSHCSTTSSSSPSRRRLGRASRSSSIPASATRTST